LQGISHRVMLSGTLRRALPLLALIAALFGMGLQPPPAALAGVAGGAWNSDVPTSLDSTAAIDRTAVKPTPPAQPQAAKKKAPEPQGAPSAVAVSATAERIAEPDRGRRVERAGRGRIHAVEPTAKVAQPRAPPSSRT
jgi:hypothetical protein